MYLSRDLTSEEVKTQKLDVMPGFRFSWWYLGTEVTPDNKYKDKEMTQQFVRYAEYKIIFVYYTFSLNFC